MSSRIEALTAATIRQRLSGTRMPRNPTDFDRAGSEYRRAARFRRDLSSAFRPAGVLIPLIERENELTVLLTERAADLRHHAGQVSFPGGGMEAGDADIVATALRETEEEIGIGPDQVDIAGFLDTSPTITGFAVTPVVGFIQGRIRLQLDPVEVEAVFEVPLDFLMDANNEEPGRWERDGVAYPVTTIHYAGHRIWGATAGMIQALRYVLFKDDDFQ